MLQIRRQPDNPPKIRRQLAALAKKIGYSSRYHEFRLKGKHPLRLLGTPKDPWDGSMVAASHLLSSRFYRDGQILKNRARKGDEWPADEVWQARDLPLKWRQYLHSFCWLRDLDRADDRAAARRRALALTDHWLRQFDRWDEQMWSPDIIGQRITNWMSYAALVLDSNDLIYRSKILNSLARQARHLYHTGDDQLRGLPRMRAIGGLVLAGLYIPHGDDWLKAATSLLKRAIEQEIYHDGGVASRNPQDLYHILRIFLMVRTSYRTMGHNVPEKLDWAINGMTPMLKSLLHGDGRLALFNGSTARDEKDIRAIFSFTKGNETCPLEVDSQQSGFRRLCHGSTVIIMDCGPPAETAVSQHCHAGTLSFEMSHGKQRIIVNCGSAARLSGQKTENDLEKLSRTTAAHSTLVLQDKNSSEIRTNGLIGRGPTLVSSRCHTEEGHSLLQAGHDGYLSRFGIMHHRNIYINESGEDIRGEDILKFEKPAPKAENTALNFVVRFHIHPDITIVRQGASDRLLLRLPTSEYWQFQCSGGGILLEESLYMGDGFRPQNCQQIILSGAVKKPETTVKWSLRHIEHAS